MKGTPETPQCGFSRAAIQILGLQGVSPQKFTAFNVLEDEELRQGMLWIPREEKWCDAMRRGLVVLYPSNDWADWETTGIKEYSDWQTIPQLYISNEFVGGTDILMSMHQDGSLSKLLEEKDVLVPAEGE
jgi:monothiol glutaredoxin